MGELTAQESLRLSVLEEKVHRSDIEKAEYNFLIKKMTSSADVEIPEAKIKVKYPWYINLVSVVLTGPTFYLSNLYININIFPYHTTTASVMIDSIIKSVVVVTITWFAYSLPRFIYAGEKRVKEEKEPIDNDLPQV